MPNGKKGDNPISDMLIHGCHPFPPDIEELVRRLDAFNNTSSMLAMIELGYQPFDWAKGKDLDKGREMLKGLIAKCEADDARFRGFRGLD